ncbi:hypothetical protein ACFQPA_13880 [Halomarina halobia]|uniref:Uncharacterized protein n=1 Tax=Halomarina halobia TaxID=3033386 RepID=A0ABD6A8T5_9EURY|nr:hypothetical protein [Halomarina sp. PSR21]
MGPRVSRNARPSPRDLLVRSALALVRTVDATLVHAALTRLVAR